jgi:AcrR family transcriptional regulator
MVTNSRLARTSPDARREQILDVAFSVFIEEGFGATSMSMIAARLGGSKATLYKYFPSKENLFRAVMSGNCERVLAPLRDLDCGANDPEKLLFEFGVAFLEALFKPEAIEIDRMVHAEGARFPELASTFFELGPDVVYAELDNALRELADKGLICCPEPLLAAEQFVGMIRGDLHYRVVCGSAPLPESAEIERQVAHATRIFISGISAI